MNLRTRNNVARLILAAYLLAGVLLEVGHHDAHDIVLGATPMLSSHNCGASEIHIPLDKRHDCLACTQSTQRLGIEVTSNIGVPATLVCLTGIADVREHPLETDVFHSGKRGPPLA